MDGCRFITSCGGVARCGDEAFRDGFCRFHFQCNPSGEITELLLYEPVRLTVLEQLAPSPLAQNR